MTFSTIQCRYHDTEWERERNAWRWTIEKTNNISETLNIEEIYLDNPFDIPETLILGTPSPFWEITPAAKKTGKRAISSDEGLANCEFRLSYLPERADHPPQSSNIWTMHRKAFKAMFGDASFEARSDGYLDDRQGNAQAIIEVKPVTWTKKSTLFQMQESVQLVAWI